MCALEFHKRALEFSLSVEKLNMRSWNIYKRVQNFHMRAAKFYKRALKFNLWKNKVSIVEENHYMSRLKVIDNFLFPLYKLFISLCVCAINICANGPPYSSSLESYAIYMRACATI